MDSERKEQKARSDMLIRGYIDRIARLLLDNGISKSVTVSDQGMGVLFRIDGRVFQLREVEQYPEDTKM